ncbi:MAG: hypothetical protein ACLP5H_23345 [Desulfomonilaceae bacterium]
MITTSKDYLISERSLDLTIPFYFSSLARQRQEDLQVGDYVCVSGLEGKYELMDIMWKYGSVRIRRIGHSESMTMPWIYVKPLRNGVVRSKTVMKAVGNWLFRGSRVYLSSEPDRILRTVKIDWGAGTSDVEDEDGRVFHDISWNDLEFWNPEDYHLPGDE